MILEVRVVTPLGHVISFDSVLLEDHFSDLVVGVQARVEDPSAFAVVFSHLEC